jgi:LPXTG-motif cell wall-anchored protein
LEAGPLGAQHLGNAKSIPPKKTAARVAWKPVAAGCSSIQMNGSCKNPTHWIEDVERGSAKCFEELSMKTFVKCSLLSLGLFFGACLAAQATPTPTPVPINKAPEIDPGLAIGGLALLGGSVMVLRSRRRK